MTKTYSGQYTGFSLVETVIIIAVIGLSTLALIAGGNQNIKVERFSGSLKNFAGIFRVGQVDSYAIKSGECPLSTECFWRGRLFELSAPGSSYETYHLKGTDVSQFVAHQDHRKGIQAKVSAGGDDLADRGLRIVDIGINCNEQQFEASTRLNRICPETTNRLSAAFLAPDGRSYIADTHYSNSQLLAQKLPFHRRDAFTVQVEDMGTELVGYVTFDPENANVNVRVR